MNYKNYLNAIVLLILVIPATTFATELKSISRIAFGPENVLFVADWKASAIIAITLPPGQADDSKPFNIMDFQKRIEKAAGSTEIKINDLKMRPNTNEVFIAVSVGPDFKPMLFSVLANGDLKLIDLKSSKTQSIAIKDAPGGEYKFWDKIPEQSFTATDMKWFDNKLYVSGLSNQNFASSLRVISYPFSEDQAISSVEIYHSSHDQIETRAPIRTMTFVDIKGKKYLLAAYMCTPLVLIPVDDIKKGAHLKGKTIAELGYGNTPLDIIAFTADEWGKKSEYVLVTNLERNAELIAMSEIMKASGRAGITKQVPFGEIQGVKLSQTPFAGAYRIDGQNAQYLVVLRRSLADGNLELVSIDKALRFRVSDFVSEYNFPGYEYKGKTQLEMIKPVQNIMKKQEGYPVTESNQPNGPFKSK